MPEATNLPEHRARRTRRAAEGFARWLGLSWGEFLDLSREEDSPIPPPQGKYGLHWTHQQAEETRDRLAARKEEQARQAAALRACGLTNGPLPDAPRPEPLLTRGDFARLLSITEEAFGRKRLPPDGHLEDGQPYWRYSAYKWLVRTAGTALAECFGMTIGGRDDPPK